MTATSLKPTPVTAPATPRTLHAFPPGSNISLCGRKLSPTRIPHGRTPGTARLSTSSIRPRHPVRSTPMNLVTIGALCGIVALVLVLVIVL